MRAMILLPLLAWPLVPGEYVAFCVAQFAHGMVQVVRVFPK